VDEAFLEATALAYLDRFDTTASHLKRVLRERVHRTMTRARRDEGQPGADAADVERWIAELLERFQASHLVDDRRFASTFVSSQRSRGASRTMIFEKLRAKGVPAELATEVLDGSEGEAGGGQRELEAARAYVRKRRMGPYRSPEEARARRQKDLAALARRGFSWDVATQALAPDGSE